VLAYDKFLNLPFFNFNWVLALNLPTIMDNYRRRLLHYVLLADAKTGLAVNLTLSQLSNQFIKTEGKFLVRDQPPSKLITNWEGVFFLGIFSRF
jgi:hypothetical protein